jgi:hypothetical protein
MRLALLHTGLHDAEVRAAAADGWSTDERCGVYRRQLCRIIALNDSGEPVALCHVSIRGHWWAITAQTGSVACCLSEKHDPEQRLVQSGSQYHWNTRTRR